MIPFKKEHKELLNNKKLVFSLTDYGSLAKNTHKIVESLRELGASYRLHPPENWTDSGVIDNFKRTPVENEVIFENCCGKNLLTLSDGRIYRCPFSANADRLNAIPLDDNNFVNANATPTEILNFTRNIKSLPACNFCKGRSFDSPKIVPAIQTLAPLKYVKIN
jgi:hypothetical protein